MIRYGKLIIATASMALILILANISYGQTSNVSTPVIDRAVIISLCEKAQAEVSASRPLILTLQEAIAKGEKEQTLSEAEILKLRIALAEEKTATAQAQLATVEYKKALAKETKKKNFYKFLLKLVVPVAVGGVTFAVIK